MVVREIRAKAILSKSQIYDYTLNACVGCGHNCAYCYAKFMKRFTGHSEQWGRFKGEELKTAFERAGIPCQKLH